MATDEVGIYNLALSVVGSTSSVSSPTEASREAEVCNLWYAPTVEKVLHAAQWPSARAVARLALVKERDFDKDWVSDDPEPPWKYAYSYPSDMLRPRFMTNFARFTTGLRNGSSVILTDFEDAILVYTIRQFNVNLWDAGLKMAIVYALAAHIAMPLSGKLERARLAVGQANTFVMEARQAVANQDNEQLDHIPEWFEARGFGEYKTQKYIFPDGPTVSIAGNPRSDV